MYEFMYTHYERTYVNIIFCQCCILFKQSIHLNFSNRRKKEKILLLLCDF